MTKTEKETTGEAMRRPYVVPTLKRIGAVRDLTLSRLMVGRMDGGPNSSRTG